VEPLAQSRDPHRETARSAFSAADVEAIALRRGWLRDSGTLLPGAIADAGDPSPGLAEWMAQAAELLGAQSSDLAGLERLLDRVFSYDAAQLVARIENQGVLSREGARDVLRELAARVLDAPAVDSDRLKEIVAALKETTGRRGPELFHPVRLALAGCAGEGEYDRVILLLDGAARLPWAVAVKGCRQRILEFCSALD